MFYNDNMSKIDPVNQYQITIDFKTLREKAGFSREMVANLAEKSERTIYRWENGESKPPKLVIHALQKQIALNQYHTNGHGADDGFTFIDLFAGIGGFRLGFERRGGHCLFTSEWNKFARQTYAANFTMDDQHPFVGDITTVPLEIIPAHDILLAGFPCQPFSIAGVSKKNALGRPHGFEDETQGTLFFNIKEILRYHRPAAFLLENVKNLVSHDKGRTFKVIRKTLEEELGYTISWRVINAKGYLPQNRERIFIAGFLHDVGFDFAQMTVPEPSDGPVLQSILHSEDGSEVAEPPYTVGIKALIADKYTLTPKLWSYLQAYAEKHRRKGNGFGFGLVGAEDTARTLSARYYKDGSEILVKRGKGERPRRLTPRECARLMGFDQHGREPFIIPVSDTQAYRQFGNAVAVPVVEDIAAYMRPFIMEAKRLKMGEAKQLQLLEGRAANRVSIAYSD